MEHVAIQNILLFFASVIGYFFLWGLWEIYRAYKGYPEHTVKRNLLTLATIALLCIPFTINGNVYTVIGNARSENSIYSVFSAYQDAKKNAFAVFGVGYIGGDKDAVEAIGIGRVFSKEGFAMQVIGIGDVGGKKEAHQIFGAGRVISEEGKAAQVFGIGYVCGDKVFQFTGIGYLCGKNEAVQVIGIGRLHSSNGNAVQFVGIGQLSADKMAGQFAGVSYLHGREKAEQLLGLTVQQSDIRVNNAISLALWQQVDNKTRSFAFWSTLEADKANTKEKN